MRMSLLLSELASEVITFLHAAERCVRGRLAVDGTWGA